MVSLKKQKCRYSRKETTRLCISCSYPEESRLLYWVRQGHKMCVSVSIVTYPAEPKSFLTRWNPEAPHSSKEERWARKWTLTTAYSNWCFVRNFKYLRPFLYRLFPPQTSACWRPSKNTVHFYQSFSVRHAVTHTEGCWRVRDVLCTGCLVPTFDI